MRPTSPTSPPLTRNSASAGRARAAVRANLPTDRLAAQREPVGSPLGARTEYARPVAGILERHEPSRRHAYEMQKR
jgi:hypothetical protein